VEGNGTSLAYFVDGQPPLHTIAKSLETHASVFHKIFNQLSRVDGSKTPVPVLERLRSVIMKQGDCGFDPGSNKSINLRDMFCQGPLGYRIEDSG